MEVVSGVDQAFEVSERRQSDLNRYGARENIEQGFDIANETSADEGTRGKALILLLVLYLELVTGVYTGYSRTCFPHLLSRVGAVGGENEYALRESMWVSDIDMCLGYVSFYTTLTHTYQKSLWTPKYFEIY